MTLAVGKRTGQGLVSDDLFSQLVDRISREHDMPHEFAARIVDQTLVFLCASGKQRQFNLSPSELVDIGWHTFILYTREYAEFCHRVTGRFIHHVPNDGVRDSGSPCQEMARSTEAIASLGFTVDNELWFTFTVKCNGGDDGCRASGGDGNENTETNGK